jgi:hypothetical protein
MLDFAQSVAKCFKKNALQKTYLEIQKNNFKGKDMFKSHLRTGQTILFYCSMRSFTLGLQTYRIL